MPDVLMLASESMPIAKLRSFYNVDSLSFSFTRISSSTEYTGIMLDM